MYVNRIVSSYMYQYAVRFVEYNSMRQRAASYIFIKIDFLLKFILWYVTAHMNE